MGAGGEAGGGRVVRAGRLCGCECESWTTGAIARASIIRGVECRGGCLLSAAK